MQTYVFLKHIYFHDCPVVNDFRGRFWRTGSRLLLPFSSRPLSLSPPGSIKTPPTAIPCVISPFPRTEFLASSHRPLPKEDVQESLCGQMNQYAAGLHKEGSEAINHYTKLELKDRFILMCQAFDEKPYSVKKDLSIFANKNA